MNDRDQDHRTQDLRRSGEKVTKTVSELVVDAVEICETKEYRRRSMRIGRSKLEIDVEGRNVPLENLFMIRPIGVVSNKL